MTNSTETVRPVSWWLHAGAILATAATLCLFIIGQFVTSFRAGMADPIWPTEPWYLLNNPKHDRGYVIEHSHRIVGFIVGFLALSLSLWLWSTEKCPRSRWAAIAGNVIMLGGFVWFFVAMILQRELLASQVQYPVMPTLVIFAGLGLILAVAFTKLVVRVPNTGLRLLGTMVLVAVILQALLGGFRVRLNDVAGTDLAAFHGIFAQIVLALLVVLAVMTERGPVSAPDVPTRALGRWSLLVTILLFLQIVWGALIRHRPTPLTERLHLLFAFAALAAGVLLIRAVQAAPEARSRAGLTHWALGVLFVVQMLLGVEAWMVKFSAGMLPELVPITTGNAAVRSVHALVGSGILASSLALSLRLRRTTAARTTTQNKVESECAESPATQGRSVEVAATLQGPAS